MTVHGSPNLPGIDVSSYSLTLEDGGGFIGDRASGRAFFGILDELRSPLSVVRTFGTTRGVD